MGDRNLLVIIGSSTRATAESAVRAGFEPWCLDQFGDVDTRQVAASFRVVADWPEGIVDALAGFPKCDWLYTGALENSPGLISEISCERRLLGCAPDALKLLRDPFWLARTLSQYDLPSLPVSDHVNRWPEDLHNSAEDCSAGWIMKPLRSAAGIGVIDWRADTAVDQIPSGAYLQRAAHGRAISGVFLADGESAKLIGFTEQLCGTASSGAEGYVYCGSIGPLSVNDISRRHFDAASRIGNAIVRQAASDGVAAQGILGVDFVLDERHDVLWLLEVNPRYTASVEVFERALSWPLLRWHIDVCRSTAAHPLRDLTVDAPRGAAGLIVGKQVVYSPGDVCFSESLSAGVNHAFNMVDRSVHVADVPATGTLIGKGEPVFSLIVEAGSLEVCRADLHRSAKEVRRVLASMFEENAES